MPEPKEYIESIKEYVSDIDDHQLYEIMAEMIKEIKDPAQIEAMFSEISQEHPTFIEMLNKIVLRKVIGWRGVLPSLLQLTIDNLNTAMFCQLFKLNNVKTELQENADVLIESICFFKDHITDILFELGSELLQRGVSEDNKSWTPLIMLYIKDQMFCRQLIKEKSFSGKELGTAGVGGNTMLHMAAIIDDREMIDFLLSRGVNIDQKNIYGYTSFELALQRGHLEFAQKVSNKTLEELKTYPQYNNMPPRMEHGKLVENITNYLKLKHQEWEQEYNIPSIGGLCNGWSFLGAIYAAKGKSEEFYKLSALMCGWDGKMTSLEDSPKGLPDDFKNLEECFNKMTNDLFWFYQQDATQGLLGMQQRESQLELISGRFTATRMTDFCIPDLTKEEEVEILNAFKPLLKNTIIDMSINTSKGFGHIVSFYQEGPDHIYYFDPTIHHELPSYSDYGQAVNVTHVFLPNHIQALRFFSLEPYDENLIRKKEEIKKLTKDFFKRFVLDNAERMQNISGVFKEAVLTSSTTMVELLLTTLQTKEELTKDDILEAMSYPVAARRPYSGLYSVYKFQTVGLTFEDMYEYSQTILLSLATAAIHAEDQTLFEELKLFMQEKEMELPKELQWNPFPASKKERPKLSDLEISVTMEELNSLINQEQEDLQEHFKHLTVDKGGFEFVSIEVIKSEKEQLINEILVHNSKLLKKVLQVLDWPQVLQEHIDFLQKCKIKLSSLNKEAGSEFRDPIDKHLDSYLEKYNARLSKKVVPTVKKS